MADADGRFVLHQVARGVVRGRIDGRMPWTDVRVGGRGFAVTTRKDGAIVVRWETLAAGEGD